MQATSEYVEQFLETIDQPLWATEERWPQVWTQDSEDPGFKFYLTAPDPYELLEDVVNLVKINENDVFYIMTGWMTPVNDDGEPEDDAERMRVRVVSALHPSVIRSLLCSVRARVSKSSRTWVKECSPTHSTL